MKEQDKLTNTIFESLSFVAALLIEMLPALTLYFLLGIKTFGLMFVLGFLLVL